MKDFNIKTRRMLAKKGITIMAITSIPGEDGSFANSQRAYKINDNGTGRVWTYNEVKQAAS